MNRPRVLFIASQPFFEWRGSPIRLGFDLAALADLGYDVDFLTLPIGKSREIDGVKIIRAPNIFFARKISIGPSPLKLAFDFIIFWMALWRVLRFRYAVVHGVEDCGFIAWVAGRLGGAKVVFERHSDPTSHKSGFFKNLMIRAYTFVERFVMRRADAVIATGPGLAEHAGKVGRASRVCQINDIPSSLADIDAVERASIRSRCIRNDGELLIGYAGSFAVYQGIDILFSAIPIVVRKEPRARFVVIGGSHAEIESRKALLCAAGCPDAAVFLGFVDPDKLPSALAAFDILLSPRISGMNTPLKLLDYLKVGTPIVATDSEANRLILTRQIAELTPPDAEGFAKGILRLCVSPERRAELAGAGGELLRTQHSFPVFKDGLRKCYAYVLSDKGRDK